MLKKERARPVSGHGGEPITGDREWRNHGGCSSFPCATCKFYKVPELFSTGTRQTLKGDHAGEKTEANRASNNQVIE